MMNESISSIKQIVILHVHSHVNTYEWTLDLITAPL